MQSYHHQQQQWGEGKGILPYPNPIAQFKKTQEEVNELLKGIKKISLNKLKINNELI